jgi:hypothetical protein
MQPTPRKNLADLAVFIPRATSDSIGFWSKFFRRYYNCSFSNNLHFTPDRIPNQYHQFTDGIRRCAGMRKLICSDGEQCNKGNSFRSYRRATLDEFGATPDQKESRHDPHVTHAQALKIKICVFAKIFFAKLYMVKLQMMAVLASVQPDANWSVIFDKQM